MSGTSNTPNRINIQNKNKNLHPLQGEVRKCTGGDNHGEVGAGDWSSSSLDSSWRSGGRIAGLGVYGCLCGARGGCRGRSSLFGGAGLSSAGRLNAGSLHSGSCRSSSASASLGARSLGRRNIRGRRLLLEDLARLSVNHDRGIRASTVAVGVGLGSWVSIGDLERLDGHGERRLIPLCETAGPLDGALWGLGTATNPVAELDLHWRLWEVQSTICLTTEETTDLSTID